MSAAAIAVMPIVHNFHPDTYFQRYVLVQRELSGFPYRAFVWLLFFVCSLHSFSSVPGTGKATFEGEAVEDCRVAEAAAGATERDGEKKEKRRHNTLIQQDKEGEEGRVRPGL